MQSRSSRRGRTVVLLVGVVVVLVAAGAVFYLRRGASQPLGSWHEPGLPMAEVLQRFRSQEDHLFGTSPEEARALLAKADSQPLQKKAFALYQAGRAFQRFGMLEESIATLEELRDVLAKANKPQAKVMFRQATELLEGSQMRLAELRNCVANHNEDSCLLPIQGGGVHLDQAPSQAAVATLEGALQANPKDLLARWLLNIASMTLGTYPDSVPAEWRIDPKVFASDAPFPRFHDVAHHAGVAVDALSGCPVMDDLDGDGDLDIVTSSVGLSDPLRLFLNNGDGTFVERTEEAGLSGELGGLACNHADYDNDGDVDILVLRGGWMGNYGDVPNSLLRNRGDATFEDVTEQAGLETFHGTQAGAWADYDLDGWLDLFIGNESTKGTHYGHPSELWHSKRDGTFENVIEGSGIALHAFAKGTCWGDYDDDGDPDLFVATCEGPSRLYRNDTPPGGKARFVDVTAAAGLDVDRRDFPCWFFDYDNDGHLDLFVGGYASVFSGDEEGPSIEDIPRVRLGQAVAPESYPLLWHNQGDGTFVDVAKEVGLHRVILLMGANYGDVDNDGWPDLYLGTGHPDLRALMANRLFRNDGGKRFEDVTTAADVGHLQKGHGVAFGDIDGDGDQDFYVVQGGWYPVDHFPNALYLNPGNGNHWVTLRLQGVQSNRSAIGARIAVAVETPEGPRTIHHLVGTGGSFGSSSLQAEIGLGDATAITSVTIAWPRPAADGGPQVIHDLAMDRVWTIREGEAPR